MTAPQALTESVQDPLQTARVLAQLERWQELLAALAPALAERRDPEAFRLASAAHRSLDDPAAARRLAEEGLALWPADDTLHAARAWSLLALSLPEAALASAHAAIAAEPEWHGYRYLESVLLRRLDRPSEAEAAIREALRLEPNDPDSLWLLATLLYEQDRREQARFIVRQGLALAPDHADLHALDGLLQDNRASRLSRLYTALRLDPTDSWKHGLLRQHQGWRRDLAVAGICCLAQLLNHEWRGLFPDWAGTLLLLAPGIWLARPGRRNIVWGFAAVSILLLGTPGSFLDMAMRLPAGVDGLALFKVFGHLLVSFMLGGLAMVVFWLLRGMSIDALVLAWRFLLDLKDAHARGVFGEKLAETLGGRGSRYNLVAVVLPLGLPLLGRDPGDALVGLFLCQPALLWLAGRLLLLPEERPQVFVLYFILSFPLGMTVALTLPQDHWVWPDRLFVALGLGLYTLLVANRFRQL